ncbi:restriction endonuclease subunit S [Heyndrickxia faecalis]|uniref:Type I restriction modification DNA specificity domain protein n=1 Tax=Heyndrickxia coagulans TaxID=1398 RepID=A0A133KMK5_HEYCO|nr:MULTISPECIES: restriction endonuclease subunit S [Heyndrickxia]KWZ80746.1 type I restriction modification DNA specificity domain protein [Heyndrickxia coagulans]
MEQKNLVPKRRFKEFQNAPAWEKRKLVDLCTTFTDGDWIEAKDQSDNGIRLIQTGNVGVNEFIDKADKSKWITEDTFNRLNCSEVYPGDILISRLPEPAGRACIVPNFEKRMITAVDCTIVRTSDECNKKYLVQYLSSESYFKSVNNFLAGGTRQRISRSNLANFIVPLPSKPEQKKIGAVLDRLDNLITLHQRKLEKMKALKSAYLSEMFPAEGERVPKRRFAGFTQAWEQHTISELADRYDNLRVPITAFDRMPGNTPYYGANGIQDYVEGFTHCGEFILVAEDGANDLQNYPVQYVNGKVWVNNHAHVLQARSEIADNKFLMNALKQTNIEPYLVGGGRAKLNADVMMKISLRVPELAEQKKIGSFFERLDHLITLHQRKLEKLQNLKKSYLNEMFV